MKKKREPNNFFDASEVLKEMVMKISYSVHSSQIAPKFRGNIASARNQHEPDNV
jgi:hypothetical protein